MLQFTISGKSGKLILLCRPLSTHPNRNSMFFVSSVFTILFVGLHYNAVFSGNQLLYNRGTTRWTFSSMWALRVNKRVLIGYSKALSELMYHFLHTRKKCSPEH